MLFKTDRARCPPPTLTQTDGLDPPLGEVFPPDDRPRRLGIVLGVRLEPVDVSVPEPVAPVFVSGDDLGPVRKSRDGVGVGNKYGELLGDAVEKRRTAVFDRSTPEFVLAHRLDGPAQHVGQ